MAVDDGSIRSVLVNSDDVDRFCSIRKKTNTSLMRYEEKCGLPLVYVLMWQHIICIKFTSIDAVLLSLFYYYFIIITIIILRMCYAISSSVYGMHTPQPCAIGLFLVSSTAVCVVSPIKAHKNDSSTDLTSD